LTPILLYTPSAVAIAPPIVVDSNAASPTAPQSLTSPVSAIWLAASMPPPMAAKATSHANSPVGSD
jgi:hypothetical protein